MEVREGSTQDLVKFARASLVRRASRRGRNVALLERNLGARLFHRSTRKLTLTDAGERFLLAIEGNLEELQQAISGMATDGGEPAGVLKVSMGLNFGADYILPLLPPLPGPLPRHSTRLAVHDASDRFSRRWI